MLTDLSHTLYSYMYGISFLIFTAMHIFEMLHQIAAPNLHVMLQQLPVVLGKSPSDYS